MKKTAVSKVNGEKESESWQILLFICDIPAFAIRL